ncbi:Uncharacterised protein [Mycobacteroides abscessus subsp. abscessus]|nr:Uncharacterised protein [Mycobacteroides abscessus subsp. abscessus]
MYEGICLVKEVDKGTKFLDTNNFGMVDFVHFSFTNQTSNDFFSAVDGILVARVDRYVTFFVDVNLNACFSDDLIDGFSTFTDDNLDLININLNSINFRSCWSQFWTNFWNSSFDHIKDFKTSFLGLSKSFRQDFCSNPLDLDIHLKGCNPVASTCNLKVHISKVVFQTLDICQYCIVITI